MKGISLWRIAPRNISGIVLILNLVFLLSCKSSFGQDIILYDSIKSYPIGGKISILEDPKALLTFSQALIQDSNFIHSKQTVPTWSATNMAVWFKFKVKNNSRERWYLEMRYPSIYEIDFYEGTNENVFKHLNLSPSSGSAKDKVRSNNIIVPLNIPQDSTRIFYLRTKSRQGLRVPLRIASMEEIYESSLPVDLFNGVYFGLILALMIYNLFVFFNIKDKAYLYYVLYILFFSLNIAYNKGYGFIFLGKEFYLYAWSGGFSILFALLFTSSFLHTSQYVPKLHKIRWIFFLILGISFFLTVLGYYVAGFKLIILNPVFLYVLIAGISVYFKGFKPAKFYIAGFGVLVTSVILYILTGLRFFPSTIVTEHFMHIGSALEAIILSFALADKLNFYKKEKEKVQEEVLQQTIQYSRQLIQSQEKERKRIAAELHDSVGQSMIMIKNKILLSKNKKGDNEDNSGLEEMIINTIQEIRNISYGLRPFQLDLLGLTQSIKSLINDIADTNDIKFKASIENIDHIFSNENEINIYRIIQECLNNIVKHSEAKEANISIRKKENELEITIEDFGKGFIDNKSEKIKFSGFGLMGIKERLNILQGKIEIEKAIPQGTSIQLILPLNKVL